MVYPCSRFELLESGQNRLKVPFAASCYDRHHIKTYHLCVYITHYLGCRSWERRSIPVRILSHISAFWTGYLPTSLRGSYSRRVAHTKQRYSRLLRDTILSLLPGEIRPRPSCISQRISNIPLEASYRSLCKYLATIIPGESWPRIKAPRKHHGLLGPVQ
ncbi:hypothetical protein CONLIGDRAFT_344129 [Coniochaeta ligniaria NRRL 30616]|uniref:Uncharacterized protein n=1 Tax=Coniochaeta ligniaria NRRL 30616 TaxID=1408157 RepID=A0A1J7IQK6_9PEZI|nr:hypothetical protein CONLIGDRAFT_344129 [Coniochaeta ligniaria NRRL 30616]